MRLPIAFPEHKPYDVVGFGLNAVDHLCRTPRFPQPTSKLLLDGYECAPGGQVATAMVALQRWGRRTAYVGAFGDDVFGATARHALEAEGVGLEGCVVRAATPNQLAVILIDGETGERTVLWHRDEALTIRPEEISPDGICAGRVLHLDGCDGDAAMEAAGWATAAGIPTVLDMDRPRPGIEALLERIDIAVVPQEFAAELTGSADPAEALPLLARSGCALAVVTCGNAGSVGSCRGETFQVPAFPVECVDTTGAGDVFHAAVIHGLLAGWEVESTLRFASAAGALQCTRLGAQAGIPDLDGVMALAARGR
jgi:sulfofructose kinase